MSTAATATEVPVAAPAKGKKKLIIILIATVLAVVLIGGGVGAYFMMKKSAAAEAAAAEGEEGGASHAPTKTSGKKDEARVPVFVPLEPFTVNLADREAERYAPVSYTHLDVYKRQRLRRWLSAMQITAPGALLVS